MLTLDVSSVYARFYKEDLYAKCFCENGTICYAKPAVFQAKQCTQCKDTYATLAPKYKKKIVTEKAREAKEVAKVKAENAKAKEREDEDEGAGEEEKGEEDEEGIAWMGGTNPTILQLFKDKITPIYFENKKLFQDAEPEIGSYENGEVAKYVSDEYVKLPPRSKERAIMLTPLKTAINNDDAKAVIEAITSIVSEEGEEEEA